MDLLSQRDIRVISYRARIMFRWIEKVEALGRWAQNLGG